jgi:hypothetical protein
VEADQITDLDGMEKLEPVDGSGHDRDPGVANGRDRPGDVDKVYHRAAKDESQRVRVVRQHDLHHVGKRLGRRLGCQGHQAQNPGEACASPRFPGSAPATAGG